MKSQIGNIIFFNALLVLCSCKHDPIINDSVDSNLIKLRWVQGNEMQTAADIETGLKWTFSFLGATLPEEKWTEAYELRGEKLTIRIDQLGFSASAEKKLIGLNESLMSSNEVEETEGLDIGRFVALTLNASNHYYALTQMPLTLAEYQANLTFINPEVAIIESAVAVKNRLISIPDTTEPLGKCAFIAKEGSDSILDNDFEILETEVTDLMPNGQFRFGIYDQSGKLVSAADPLLGIAGKPAKCIWCHESSLQPPYAATTTVQGYLSPKELEKTVKNRISALETYRNQQSTILDFSELQAHAQMELIYISFMEPSLERLMNEWSMDSTQVMELVRQLTPHTNAEFPYLGSLYDRKDIDDLSPYKTIRVADFAREPSMYEPELITP